jgi:6-pyruvoyl-tetrahydropterin synthase
MTVAHSLQCLQQKVSWETLDSKLVKKKKKREIVDLLDREMVNPSKRFRSEGSKAHLERDRARKRIIWKTSKCALKKEKRRL